MRTLLIAIVVVVVGFKGLGWFFSPPADSPTHVVNAEPLVTVAPTAMPTATPSLIQHGEPVRMQFQRGTYGGTYQAGSWVLWARAGQTLTLSGAELVNALLTAPDGSGVLLEGNRATLPASGDYLLTVAGIEQFGIDIR